MPDPFVSRADLSDMLGQDVTTDDKALIAVDSACDIVRTLTGQTLNLVNDDTITLDGTGTDALPLPEQPVINAGTVIEAGGTLTLDTDYTLGDNGVLYRMPGVIENGWGTEQLRTYWWPGRQNITVTYSHGYSEVPRDLRQVALQLASRLYRQDSGVVFESLGQRSIRYAGAAADITPTEKLILDRHR